MLRKKQDCSPILISMYFHPEPAGSAPPITDLSLWMSKAGLDSRVVTARPSYPDRIVYADYAQGAHDDEMFRKAHVIRLASHVSRSGGILGRLMTELSFLKALIVHRISSGASSDVVISVCPSVFTVLGAALFRRRGGRHVAIVHDIQSGLGQSTGQSRLAMKALARLETVTLNLADGIVTLTAGMERVLREAGVRKPIVVLPPQVDSSAFPDLPVGDSRLAVYSGAMGRKQGLDQLLQAAALLQERGSDIRIVIRGQGGIKPDLERMAAEMRLRNLSFEPLAPEADYHAAMAEAAVHLVPQDAAGADFALPSKVYSIMASRRPFIATAVPGSPLARLIAESRAGEIVPPEDPAALADRLETLLDDPALCSELGRNGRVYVETNADSDVVCARIWANASKGQRDTAPKPSRLASAANKEG